MEKKVLLCLLILSFLAVNFPKLMLFADEKSVYSCSCSGLSYSASETKRYCLGMKHSCRELAGNVSSGISLSYPASRLEELCPPQDCQSFSAYLGAGYPALRSEQQASGIILLVDSSSFMKKEWLEAAAAAASKAFTGTHSLSHMAVLYFNSTAGVAYPYGNNITQAIQTLRSLAPGGESQLSEGLSATYGLVRELERDSQHTPVILVTSAVFNDTPGEQAAALGYLRGTGAEIYTIWLGSGNDSRFSGRDAYGLYGFGPPGLISGSGSSQQIYLCPEAAAAEEAFLGILSSIQREESLFEAEHSLPEALAAYDDEPVPVFFRLKARGSGSPIPGLRIDAQGISCLGRDSMDVTLVLESPYSGYIEASRMNFSEGWYFHQYSGLSPGHYLIKALVSGAGEAAAPACGINETLFLSLLRVYRRQESSCTTLNCSSIRPFFRRTSIQSAAGAASDAEGPRIILVVDTSASMAELGKFSRARVAVARLLGTLRKGTMVSLVEFNDAAYLSQVFTTDREKVLAGLDSALLSGSTRFMPALEKVEDMLSGSSAGAEKAALSYFVFLISDGYFWDNLLGNSLYEKAESIASKGGCIFAINYGSSSGISSSEKRMRELAQASQDALGCGGYFLFNLNSEEIEGILSQLYSSLMGSRELAVTPRINSPGFYEGEMPLVFASAESSYNGVALPFELGNCTSGASIRVTYLDSASNPLISEMMAYSEAYGYYLVGRGLSRETASIRLDAAISTPDGSDCNLTGFTSIPVSVMSREDSGFHMTFLYITAHLFIFVMAFYTILFMLISPERK